MKGPEIHFYRQDPGEDRVEVSREEFTAASENSGLVLHGPNNFRIGDVNYSYEVKVPPMTEEEIAEAKANWREAQKNPGPPKMLLEHDEPAPDGWTEDMIERRPPRAKGEMTIHLPDGSHNGIQFKPPPEIGPVVGVGIYDSSGKEVPINGFWDRWGATTYPDDDEGSESPFAGMSPTELAERMKGLPSAYAPIVWGTDWPEEWGSQYPGTHIDVDKFSATFEISGQYLEDSKFDLGKFLTEGPGPKKPLTRRERWRKWREQKRIDLAREVYYKMTGEYPPPEDY